MGQLNRHGRAKKPIKSTLPKLILATAINQVLMMDVTWLPSRVKGQFYYLYMIEDLFSRYGVRWEVFEQESCENTCRVIEQSLLAVAMCA